ncbi:MAG: hypothetical protein GX328_06620 [Clostridiaceae bacterium]|nr:hypothetical protein [Clostridiaceae bacterium]
MTEQNKIPNKNNTSTGNEEILDDDGRVYADMSMIDEMTPAGSLFGVGRKKKIPRLDENGYPIKEEDNSIELEKEEKKQIVRGVIRAHLVFALVGIAFIALMYVLLVVFWLK